jgi:hypothetical protein
MSNGIVIYRGPSILDGSPIVVIATGLGSGSSNRKTGALVQTWILRDDVSPIERSRAGLMFQSVALAHIVDGLRTGETWAGPVMLTSAKRRSIFGEPIIACRSPMASRVQDILRRAGMNCRQSLRGAWFAWDHMAIRRRFRCGYGKRL